MADKGTIKEEKVGSKRYQNEHMDMIFGEGCNRRKALDRWAVVFRPRKQTVERRRQNRRANGEPPPLARGGEDHKCVVGHVGPFDCALLAAAWVARPSI